MGKEFELATIEETFNEPQVALTNHQDLMEYASLVEEMGLSAIGTIEELSLIFQEKAEKEIETATIELDQRCQSAIDAVTRRFEDVMTKIETAVKERQELIKEARNTGISALNSDKSEAVSAIEKETDRAIVEIEEFQQRSAQKIAGTIRSMRESQSAKSEALLAKYR
jgi:hypothetical protein